MLKAARVEDKIIYLIDTNYTQTDHVAGNDWIFTESYTKILMNINVDLTDIVTDNNKTNPDQVKD